MWTAAAGCPAQPLQQRSASLRNELEENTGDVERRGPHRQGWSNHVQVLLPLRWPHIDQRALLATPTAGLVAELGALGFPAPQPPPLGQARSFDWVADCLAWLCTRCGWVALLLAGGTVHGEQVMHRDGTRRHRWSQKRMRAAYRCRAAPDLAVPPRDYSSEAARVEFFSGLGAAFYEQTHIRLNLRRLYRAGGGAARELHRLAAAVRAAAAAVAAAPPTPAGLPEPAALQRQLEAGLAAARQQAGQLEAAVAAAGQEVAVLEGARARLGAQELLRSGEQACGSAAKACAMSCGIVLLQPMRHDLRPQPPHSGWHPWAVAIASGPDLAGAHSAHALPCCSPGPCRPRGEAALRARQAGAPSGLPAGMDGGRGVPAHMLERCPACSAHPLLWHPARPSSAVTVCPQPLPAPAALQAIKPAHSAQVEALEAQLGELYAQYLHK